MGSKQDKFAVFIDDKLALVLSGQAVLDSGLSPGQEVSSEEIAKLSSKSVDDKLYQQALKYISLRLRSEGEMAQYLKRKSAKPDQVKQILEKLKDLDLINDQNFARAYIHDRLMLSTSSRRKLTYELRKKQIAEDVIEHSLANDQISDMNSLSTIIESKRAIPKYQDDLKLMQYLVRQGFNYSDVKEALKTATQ